MTFHFVKITEKSHWAGILLSVIHRNIKFVQSPKNCSMSVIMESFLVDIPNQYMCIIVYETF